MVLNLRPEKSALTNGFLRKHPRLLPRPRSPRIATPFSRCILSINVKKSVVLKVADEAKILYEAIGKLNKAEKSLILLYLDNLHYNEIAEITGISVSNVGVKINRIKSKLQKILKELGYGF